VPAAPVYASSLAASGRRRPPQRATSKNSRLGFFGTPSGRTLGKHRSARRTAPGYRACGYKTASGRPKWLNRDPIGEKGGLNLYGYVFNNPISYVDPLGLAVYVGEHGALFDSDPLQHTAIVLRPDNPADFSGNQLFTDPNQATLGGQPGAGVQNGNAPNLISFPNYPRDNPGSDCHPGRLKNLTLVPTPAGMTDTQFIQALISAAGSYQNNLPYALFPVGAAYNSNSYVSGVILAAGGTPPTLPGVQPGYGHPIPLR
jgi:RHS repeat-associated protein